MDAAVLEVLFKDLNVHVVPEPKPPQKKVLGKGGEPEVSASGNN